MPQKMVNPVTQIYICVTGFTIFFIPPPPKKNPQYYSQLLFSVKAAINSLKGSVTKQDTLMSTDHRTKKKKKKKEKR